MTAEQRAAFRQDQAPPLPQNNGWSSSASNSASVRDNAAAKCLAPRDRRKVSLRRDIQKGADVAQLPPLDAYQNGYP